MRHLRSILFLSLMMVPAALSGQQVLASASQTITITILPDTSFAATAAKQRNLDAAVNSLDLLSDSVFLKELRPGARTITFWLSPFDYSPVRPDTIWSKAERGDSAPRILRTIVTIDTVRKIKYITLMEQ